MVCFFHGFDAKEFGARPLGGLLARLAHAFAILSSARVPVAGFLGEGDWALCAAAQTVSTNRWTIALPKGWGHNDPKLLFAGPPSQ